MKSTGLKRFVQDRGINKAIEIWGVSRQAIEGAIKDGRDIQIIELDHSIEVVESKLLRKVRIK